MSANFLSRGFDRKNLLRRFAFLDYWPPCWSECKRYERNYRRLPAVQGPQTSRCIPYRTRNLESVENLSSLPG